MARSTESSGVSHGPGRWAVVIPADQWVTERLFHNDVVTVPGAARAVSAGAEVLLVADGHVVGLARAARTDGDDLVLAYRRRAFDDPVPAAELIPAGPSSVGQPVPAAAGEAVPGAAGETVSGAAGEAVPGAAGEAGPDSGAEAGVVAVEPELFRRLAGALDSRPPPARPSWLVSVTLPIEAVTPAEAVRQFWSHVLELGPAELPTYVWPYGDELAMQAFVLGEEANQDPEDEDDDQ